MNFKEEAKRQGLSTKETEHIEKRFEEIEAMTKEDIEKLIVVLETRKSYLPLMFNFPVVAITIALGLPAIMDFILPETEIKFWFGFVFLIYISMTSIFTILKTKQYALKVKEVSLELETCRIILDKKSDTI